jgi:hypothetical protein
MRICTLNTAGIGFVLATALSACSGGSLFGSSQPAAQSAATEAPLSPPPVELAGGWQLAAASGGSCIMNFADGAAAAPSPGAPAVPAGSRPGQGTIAPEGGCPGNFFTSRQWTYQADMLIIRDFRNRPLARFSYSGGDFQGQDAELGALTLSKRM